MTKDSEEQFKVTLEAARVNAGYTQTEAGKQMGRPYSTIAGWEQNSTNITYYDVLQLAKVYGIKPDRIYFGKKSDFIRKVRNGENLY